MYDSLTNVIAMPERLEKLRELDLLDTPAEKALDRLTRLAGLIIDTPISQISIIDANRQFLKSGLSDPVDRNTPLSHSFCKYVAASGEELIVEDAREHPVLQHNPAVPDLNVIGYLGMPLITSDGVELGAFCVVDHKPRRWTKREIEIVRELAFSAMTEIELRYEINRRQSAEATLRELNAELGAYSHTVAHDLNSPLAIIVGYSDLLKDMPVEEISGEAVFYVKRIHTAAGHMSRMIRQLLELAKLHDTDTHREVVDMNGIATSAFSRFEMQLEQAYITAELENLPCAYGHGAWVEEIFANLISNAIKYMGSQSERKITIASKPAGLMNRYEVRDTGIGIRPEHQAHLFQMFSRLHTIKVEGLGIGLSIVKRLVTKLGGQIGVESIPGKGSTFWFTLPSKKL